MVPRTLANFGLYVLLRLSTPWVLLWPDSIALIEASPGIYTDRCRACFLPFVWLGPLFCFSFFSYFSTSISAG